MPQCRFGSPRTSMPRGVLPSDAAVAKIESDHPNTRVAGLARVVRARIRLAANDQAGAATLLDNRNVLQNTAIGQSRKAEIAILLRRHRVDQKQIDALELLAAIGRPRLRHRGVTPLGRAELNDTGFLNG